MNALAESIAPAPPVESLTASQWSKMLGITTRAFNLRRIAQWDLLAVRGGLTKHYPFDALPADYRSILEERRRQLRCLRFADLLDVQTTERWQPEKHIKQMPVFTQVKAEKVRDVLAVYFGALDQGMTEVNANTKARAMWLQVFGETCNEKTIRRRAAKVEARGGPELARIEAYADGKSVPHHKAKLVRKLDIPDEFIRAFKSKCLEPGVLLVSAAYRHFVIDWAEGREVPGFGSAINFRAESGDREVPAGRETRHSSARIPFPLTVDQCRSFAPPRAAMLQAGRGKFAAKAEGALATMVTTSANLRRCERYLFDDTRINIACLDDVHGKPIELKSYWAMEESSRQIVGYVVRQAGDMRASDTDALVSRVLRTCGLAAPGAGYVTTLKFERGTVACSPARQVYLESMFPGQIKISRTSMIGGQNAPGDFRQENSGNFWGKGKIESWMRTLAFFCQHLKGQRGGTYAKQPAMLGSAGLDRKTGTLRFAAGTQIDEAVLTAQAARALAMLESRGNDLSPEARLAQEAFKIENPLYYESEVRAALAQVVAYYNARRGHRMEGFRTIAFEKSGGGLDHVTESPNDKALRLERELEAIGKAPQRISPADACALMLRARRVTCRANGVTLKIDGKAYRFWDPNSLAVAEAQRLATLEKDYIALLDRDVPHEIYLLRNSASEHPQRREFNFTGTAQYFEALPLAEASDVTDPASMARGMEATRSNHNRITREIVRDIAPYLSEQEARRSHTANTVESLCRVMGVQRAEQRRTALSSALSDNVSEARSATRDPRTRAEQQPTAAEDFAAYLAGQTATHTAPVEAGVSPAPEEA